MSIINDDARMAELYKMRSEGVELEWLDPTKMLMSDPPQPAWYTCDPREPIMPDIEYRPKPKPVYVWIDPSRPNHPQSGTTTAEPTPRLFFQKTVGCKRYQLIEAPEDE